MQIFAELDRIAGTSGARTFKREVLLQFLRNKQWIIEEIQDIPDVEPSAPSVTEMKDKEPTNPKQHIIFTSSSENYSWVPSPKNRHEKKDEERHEEKDEDQENEDDDDDNANQSSREWVSE